MRSMRSIATLFALGLMMAFLHRVTAGGPLEARATLALASSCSPHTWRRNRAARAAAATHGLSADRFRRRAGVAEPGTGARKWTPFGSSRLCRGAHRARRGIGAHLDALRQSRVALARVATGAIGFPFFVVLSYCSRLPVFPLTRHQPVGDAVVVALVLGTLAATSSPAVTMAIMSELDARGPVARALLGVTVVQDIAVVILFTLVLVFAGRSPAPAP